MLNAQKILVIKLGALGDFIQAAGPFEAIRKHHSGENITLLTSENYLDLAKASPWFDHVKIDHKPNILQISKWLKLREWMSNAQFTRIYDLQTSDRSSFYYKLISPINKSDPKPDWSGIASGCSHPHNNPKRDFMHTIDRQAEQLRLAGIDNIPPINFSWMNSDIKHFGLDEKYVLIVPGGASHRLSKRWPSKYYKELINYFISKKTQVVLIGGEEEKVLLNGLAMPEKSCISLAGATTLRHIFSLARESMVTIGNDTGPMHIAAASGCKTIVLYTSASDPALCAQRGNDVKIIQKDNISDIKPNQIIKSLGLRER
jgi:ADP-heptose:LPS heptosyltransferase